MPPAPLPLSDRSGRTTDSPITFFIQKALETPGLISLAAGLLFGIAPIIKYARPQLANALKENGRGSSDGRDRHRTRNTLVVAQVAMALVLLVASALMIRTFNAMRHVPPGFTNPEQVLTVRISIPTALVEDPAQVARTHEEIQRRIAAIAGVTSVGASSSTRRESIASRCTTSRGPCPPLP